MVKVLVIQHEDGVGIDRFGDWLREAGAQLHILRPDRGDEVPQSLTGYDALVVLGGTAGPEDDERWSWLPAVRSLQRQAAQRSEPAFNICLGAQLAAVAHEVEVFRRAKPQIGVMELHRRPEAAEDPVFSVLPERPRAVMWHQEQIAQVPEGAVHLVDGTDAPVQAFRVGDSSWSVQFHPEVNAETLRGWARDTAHLVERAGLRPDRVLEEFDAQAAEIEETFKPLAAAFVDYARRS
ncbi:type 1 glutamine amidotransferase [Nesterenkonia flava]|uniref:Type 1 glutamine amidotransferase n=1 Tax=Nesterenkonia flava TaxID=469799 RepID=A0ABU1FUA3_9MICC|nr:type 1 glutamine amidotransferase [Nesterenkonia flava]MDR5711731.1 type 1 glutamine amidotransferase [Nesterenkonia flava]